MPQKRRTSETSSGVSRQRRAVKPRRSRLFTDLMAGLKGAKAHLRGEISLPVRHYPGPVDVKSIRSKSGLSQLEFADRYGFSRRTLQEWEQGRAQPESAVRAYLTVIDRNPKAVEEALRAR